MWWPDFLGVTTKARTAGVPLRTQPWFQGQTIEAGCFGRQVLCWGTPATSEWTELLLFDFGPSPIYLC